jgi:colicin import membrane protein
MRIQIMLLLALAGLGGCTTVLLPPNVEPVVAPSTSVAQAARRLDEVKRERAAAEAAYGASEQLCYAKFFVNNCLDTAKEKRRSRLAVLRAIEVEAEYYKRKAAVDQRDRDVAQAIKDFESGEARMAAQPAPVARPEVERTAPAPRAAMKERISKADEHAAQQRAQAPQRAANAQAFAERKRKSEERQRKIAEKKAEKAAKAAK